MHSNQHVELNRRGFFGRMFATAAGTVMGTAMGTATLCASTPQTATAAADGRLANRMLDASLGEMRLAKVQQLWREAYFSARDDLLLAGFRVT